MLYCVILQIAYLYTDITNDVTIGWYYKWYLVCHCKRTTYFRHCRVHDGNTNLLRTKLTVKVKPRIAIVSVLHRHDIIDYNNHDNPLSPSSDLHNLRFSWRSEQVSSQQRSVTRCNCIPRLVWRFSCCFQLTFLDSTIWIEATSWLYAYPTNLKKCPFWSLAGVVQWERIHLKAIQDGHDGLFAPVAARSSQVLSSILGGWASVFVVVHMQCFKLFKGIECAVLCMVLCTIKYSWNKMKRIEF